MPLWRSNVTGIITAPHPNANFRFRSPCKNSCRSKSRCVRRCFASNFRIICTDRQYNPVEPIGTSREAERTPSVRSILRLAVRPTKSEADAAPLGSSVGASINHMLNRLKYRLDLLPVLLLPPFDPSIGKDAIHKIV